MAQRRDDTVPAGCHPADTRRVVRHNAVRGPSVVVVEPPEPTKRSGERTSGRPRNVDPMDFDATDDRPVEPAGPILPPSPRRPRFSLPRKIPRKHWPLLGLSALVVGLAVVAGTLAWVSGPDKRERETGVADPSAAVSSDGRAVPSDGMSVPSVDPLTPTLAPGEPLAVAGWDPVAELTADDAPGGVLDVGTGFRLTSLGDTTAAALATRLTVEPSIEYAVTPEAGGRSARIVPLEPLTAGAVYRFTLATDDGRPLDSWAFQSGRPLRIVGTTPGDTQNDVPLDTGIEFLFDQDGVVDAAAHMSIEPPVDGRFEQHGRVLTFIPKAGLRPATVYTVTVSAGVSVAPTGERLEADVRFMFETAAPSGTELVTFRFSDDVFEARPTEAATIALWAFQEWEGDQQPAPPKSAPIEIYRFPDLQAAIDAFRAVRSTPAWAKWSTTGAVPTAGLTRVAAFDADLQDAGGVLWFRPPERLPAGEYLVQLASPTRPIQAMLQVTDIAAYLVVSDTSTLVWANDLRTRGPLAGATVRAEGVDLGRTEADGALLAKSPDNLLPRERCPSPCVPVVVVQADGQAMFLPATGPRDAEGKGFWDDPFGPQASDYWQVFETDRTVFSRTDTIGTYGVIRDRDSGAVPDAVSLRLFSEDARGDGPPIATVAVRPNEIGAFSATVPLDDLPEASYRVELRVGSEVVDQRGVRIDRIRKPGYRLELTTGRRVYIEGDRVRVTAKASFYEGSPVPNLPIELTGVVDGQVTTDATGTAIIRGTAHVDEEEGEGASTRWVAARPGRAEEGEISGTSPYVLVFPSAYVFDASARLAGGRILVDGSVHEVDRDRLEQEIAASGESWGLDHLGAAVAGASVTASFVEIIPRRIQTGTEYDFIQKKAVPIWEYESTERDAGTVRVRTGRGGTFAADIPAPGEAHSFIVRLSVRDPDGHTARYTAYVDEPGAQGTEDQGPSLLATTERSPETYSLGDAIDLTMSDPSAPASEFDRYLFVSAQRGLRDAVIQSSARYRDTIEPWVAPVGYVTGVRFTGDRFVVSPTYQASFRSSDRALRVDLTTDSSRYAPGDEVTVTVTTRDPGGARVPSTVTLRAVDEKLFTMGAAETADPLAALYGWVPSGVWATYRSHRTPQAQFEGGDTAGGDGDRADFRDMLLFRTIETGADGRASVTFDLSDDLTSWRISAAAFGAGLTAGEASLPVPVGLPFFVDATIAPEYLVSDRPEIAVRAFGSAIDAEDRVTFSVDSDSLGLHLDGVRGEAFQPVSIPLPKLRAGNHRITITARTGSGSAARTDRLTRTISVVETRLARSRTSYQVLTGPTRLDGGDGLHEVVVAAAGSAGYAPFLLDAAGVDSARLEDALAASLADATLERWFSDAGRTDAAATFDGSPYQVADGGLAVLPYASTDLEASALAAIVAPDRFDGPRLEAYFENIVADEAETRERRAYALAGLGGLGAPALPRLRAAVSDPDLTIRERLILGLGIAAIGDSATARGIATRLADDVGESIDADAARLRVSDAAHDVTAATALMALLTAELGDPLAPRFWRYVLDNPSKELTTSLQAVGAAAAVLDRAAPVPTSFAYELDGERKVVELEPGDSFRMMVTERQLRAMTIQPVKGEVGVTTTWREPLDVDDLASEPGLSIKRQMDPAGKIRPGDLVVVDITVELPSNAPSGCHPVAEVVPSGLVPVGSLYQVYDPDSGNAPADYVAPYAQIGQHVYFCAENEPSGGRLRYVARVVTGGSYTWEPTVVGARNGTDRAATTGSSVVVID